MKRQKLQNSQHSIVLDLKGVIQIRLLPLQDVYPNIAGRGRKESLASSFLVAFHVVDMARIILTPLPS